MNSYSISVPVEIKQIYFGRCESMRTSSRLAAVLSLGIALAVLPVSAGGPPNPTMSDATHSTAGGTNALFNNTGLDNTAFGESALFNNAGGEENTATGYRALTANTSGNRDTATGFE